MTVDQRPWRGIEVRGKGVGGKVYGVRSKVQGVGCRGLLISKASATFVYLVLLVFY